MPKTGMYVLQGVTPSQIAAAPFDVKVIDIYNDAGQTFTPAEVKQMGGGPGSALLLGYFSIGEAETYRDYFKTIPAAALGPENPQWKGNYEVAFWTPEWKAVATAYIDRMLAAGYDGVYFDVVDEYQTSWAKSHAPGGAAGAEQAMVDLIKYLGDYAEAKHPGFKVWVNNAEELLTHPGYLGTIDGMFKENLFYTDGGQKQPAAETSYSMGLLQKAIDAGKDVISIEYVTGAQKVADVHALDDKYGISSYVAHLDLNGVDTEGVRPGQVMHDDALGAVQPPVPAPPLTTPPVQPDPLPAQKVVAGDASDNRLKGTSGDDIIKGLGGHDRLTGLSGADTFVFQEYGRKNSDTITDFKHGTDHIGLDHAVFQLAQGELSPDAFWVGSKAHDANDRVIYNKTSGDLLYDPDGSGSAAPQVIANIGANMKIDYHDILSI
ncbi:endo alpha-1,4 polygalactosaminidase [Methylobacterium durans]|uniref:Glycoside-hydrolase family GH114 TIM-barrel domain-containing protein n=1 Tax=Methylobacterium durans TaxID=2202825 RepID=A0A2U8W3S2_9HYPH|nr:endo alpha-1,4 polygalactosaminidase [Methylobacterium durans]AWN40298.1 hypothetical protein DK389_06810 [Methylobacterium durans]